ncbi:hypothetical protein G6F58_013453 [Rhizopus delemar]|nr:hypothetical protein G6F58_013453 [Rhizopus delemar]
MHHGAPSPGSAGRGRHAFRHTGCAHRPSARWSPPRTANCRKSRPWAAGARCAHPRWPGRAGRIPPAVSAGHRRWDRTGPPRRSRCHWQ